MGFGAIQPDRSGIIGVASKEQSVGAIEKTDGVRRVTRSRNDFERAATEIDFETVVNRVGNFPGFCRLRFWIERVWQIAAELAGRNFRLRIFARAFGFGSREVCVHAVSENELPVAT